MDRDNTKGQGSDAVVDAVSCNLHELYMLIGQLKRVKRTGWVLRQVSFVFLSTHFPRANINF